MMIEEFEQRTGYFPSSAEYKAIEAAYMEFDGDKDEFCKAYKKNANGIAERIAEAASSMKLSPEAVQRILDAFDRITETIKDLCEWAAQTIRTLADFFTETLGDFMLRRAPPKWRHYALHAKRARVRKKYRNRIRRAFFAALASEGGGSS